MMKRIISLVLCLGMIAGALLMAGCEADTTVTSSNEALPMTLNFVGITEESTTAEAIEATEEALNRIFKTEFKTKVELTFVTADEYIDLIEERVAEAEQAALRLRAIGKYNTYAQTVAAAEQKALADAKEKDKGLFSKWTQNAEVVEASTLSTGTVYSVEQTTIYEDGKIETLYPSATSPIDILMIDGKEMYDYLDEKGYLLSVNNKLETEFTKFKQYIYPTFLDQLKTITGDIKAIPNNNLLAEYTYLVVDKELAEKYDFDVDAVETYADLDVDGAGFLSAVAANENVTPMVTKPDALGIYQYFEGDTAVGTYFDPIYGYDTAEGTDFTIQNLFNIPQYTDHLLLMETYEEAGYFTDKGEKYAVNVVKGDASLAAEYSDEYYVKVLQNPFVEMDSIFDGMLAVSSYTANDSRALQIIQAITTDPEVKNILQYGIAYDGENDAVANYKLNETEDENGDTVLSITRLNDKYMMDNRLTGNVYMGYPEEGENVKLWDYYKQTNLDSALSPFMYFYVSQSDLDGMLSNMLRRAALTEALTPLGIDYDEYEKQSGTPAGNTMRRQFKQANVEFFASCLAQEKDLEAKPVNLVIKGEGSALEQDFIDFVLSKEGQTILSSVGFTALTTDAASYQKKEGLSGEIKFTVNTGTTITDYVDSILAKLIEAYTALNPNVTITVPAKVQDKGHDGDLTKIDNSSVTIGFSLRDLVYTEQGKGLEVYQIAKSYLETFNNDSHEVYRASWYENKYIEKVTAEKYSDIISATELDKLTDNKVASLAGVVARGNAAGTESAILAKAQESAKSYYENIEFLRIMTAEVLFDAAETAEYAKLADTDFETAVFNYVRANYETENNLTEEDYVERVQNFMVSVLQFVSPEDKNTKYTVSWDEFQEAKENAQVYIEAATKIKDAYYDQLIKEVGSGMLRLLSLPEVMDEVYTIMYNEYLTENGLEKEAFENSIKDIYLGEVSSSAEEFAAFAKTSDEYKNICQSLRKEYKKLLINLVGKTVYDKGESGLSNEDLLDTLFDYFLEEELKINDKMAEFAGIDYDTFSAAETHMSNYDMYISEMKTKFLYTLRTQYTDSQINNWSYEEAETNIYNVLYEVGFYTNELAKYIGLELRDFMLAKSNAVTYQNYMKTLATELRSELTALGHNVDELLKGDGVVLLEAAYDIVLEKYFSDKVDIETVVEAASAKYIQGLETASDLEAYIEEAKAATNADYFYMAVINSLQSSWKEAKGE